MTSLLCRPSVCPATQTVGWRCRTDNQKIETTPPPTSASLHLRLPASAHHSSHLSFAHETALPETRRSFSIRSQNHQQSLGMILTVSHPRPPTRPQPASRPAGPSQAKPGRQSHYPDGGTQTARETQQSIQNTDVCLTTSVPPDKMPFHRS